MKIKKLISLLIAASIFIASIGNTIACTALTITDINGKSYHARTMEFGGLMPGAVTYIPVGSKIESVTSDGKKAKTFDMKYAVIGVTVPAVPNTKQDTIGEGMNDQGLSFSANAFNASSAAPVGNDASRILSASDFGAWILGNFKTAPETKAAILSGDTQFWLPPFPLFGNELMPLHYVITDKKGESIVVEFANNKTNVYDNPINAMTNGPEFPWHLENMSNYTFTNVDKNTGQLGKLKLATQDAGIALTGLPSAQTSQGRLVKAAFYSNYVRKAKTPDEAVVTLAHIINNFDRPYDLTVDGAGGQGDGPRGKKLSSETTNYTMMSDQSRGLFYFRSINVMNWSVVDMNKLKDLKQVKKVNIYDAEKPGADIFKLFYS